MTGGQNQGCTLGGCNRIPGEENGDDTGLLQSGQNKTVLFLDVDQDKAILCLIYRRCLWYQLYVPGHFNQLRFNPKVAS